MVLEWSLAAVGSNRAWQGDVWYFKAEVGCLAQVVLCHFDCIVSIFALNPILHLIAMHFDDR